MLTMLTGKESRAAAYEFTTVTCIPGVFSYKGAKFQLLDLPGIIEGAKDNKGRGKQVIGVARTCNLILIVLDAQSPMKHKQIIENELEGFGIRLNKKPPRIKVRKVDKGGIGIIRNTEKLEYLNDDLVSDTNLLNSISNPFFRSEPFAKSTSWSTLISPSPATPPQMISLTPLRVTESSALASTFSTKLMPSVWKNLRSGTGFPITCQSPVSSDGTSMSSLRLSGSTWT
jgi:small GTP-binding protein